MVGSATAASIILSSVRSRWSRSGRRRTPRAARWPRLHGLGGVFLGDLELLARGLLQADRLVVHHVGVGLHALEDEVRVERHVAVEQRLADHVGGERPGLLDHLERSRRSSRACAQLLHLGADGGVGSRGCTRRTCRGGTPAAAACGSFCHSAPSWVIIDLPKIGFRPVEIFDVVVGLGDQHVLEVVRVGAEEDTFGAHVDGDYRPIALGQFQQHRHRVVVVAARERRQLEPNAVVVTELLDLGIDRVHGSYVSRRQTFRPSTAGR